MIYVNLRGRIGNQLFIYSLARYVQEKTGDKIILCGLMQKRENPDFKIDIQQYKISDKVSIDNTIKFPWFANNNFLPIKVCRKLFPNLLFNILSKFNVFLWLGETYKNFIPKSGKNIYIDGFWQSEKYFKDYKSIILPELVPIQVISEENQIMLESINNSESVCITIRRGDYISNANAKKMYYLCDEKYFEKSIDLMYRLKPSAKWFVFSDDVEWAKQTFKLPGEAFFESGQDSVSEKLYLMSHCKHFIISNSSFSWWAQYMNTNSDKIVIAPSMWYTDGRHCDIYEDTWKLMNVGRSAQEKENTMSKRGQALTRTPEGDEQSVNKL